MSDTVLSGIRATGRLHFEGRMFELRHYQYSRRDYIDHGKYTDNREVDKYDDSALCTYFVAVLEG